MKKAIIVAVVGFLGLQGITGQNKRRLTSEQTQVLTSSIKERKITSNNMKKYFPHLVGQESNSISVYKLEDIRVFFIISQSDSVTIYNVLSVKADSIIHEICNLVITKSEFLYGKKVTKFLNDLVINQQDECIYISQLSFDPFVGDTLKIAPKIQILNHHRTKQVLIKKGSITETNY